MSTVKAKALAYISAMEAAESSTQSVDVVSHRVDRFPNRVVREVIELLLRGLRLKGVLTLNKGVQIPLEIVLDGGNGCACGFHEPTVGDASSEGGAS